MKYVNNDDEMKKVRVYNKKEPCGYSWLNVKPGDEVEGLNSRQAKLLGFTEVKETEKEKNKRLKEENEALKKEGMLSDEPFEETLPGDVREKYKKRLLKVKGLGPKTVKDLMKVYPTMKDLKKALKEGIDLPVRDDMALTLSKEEF